MEQSIAIYTRVSKRTGQDEASQLPDLERYVKSLKDPVTWYRDKFTGKSMNRPDWDRLHADYESGRVSSIVVWRLDRLGRSASGLTALFVELQARKINLVSLKDGLDLSTPAGRLMAHVLASVAQYETEVRAERVLAGLEAARAKGVQLGRKPVAAGERAKRIKVTPEQEATVRELAARGDKKAGIARATGLSRPTVYQILASAPA